MVESAPKITEKRLSMGVALFFGGSSYEHEISIISAISLSKKLNVPMELIFISKDREFYSISRENFRANLFSSGKYKKEKKLEFIDGRFYKRGLFGKSPLEFELAINLVHGRDGEDGKIASMFDFFGIPYIGPRCEASVVSYNKLLTKQFAKSRGVEVLDYESIKRGQKPTIPLPLIVKPLRLGSSIGLGIAKENGELDYALDVGFEYDNELLIEPFIENIQEYNLAGYKGEEFRFSIIEEVKKEGHLDFDKKYLDFGRSEGPKEAELDSKLRSAMEESFKKIYENCFEGSIIRCDFFVHNQKVYLNEINPVPGSLANYLFPDIQSCIAELSSHLPSEKKIDVEYLYINKINSSKGK